MSWTSNKTALGFAVLTSTLLATAPASADAEHDAANYVNANHHSRLLDSLRTSFDRWDNLAQTYPTAQESLQSFHIYGAQYDLNYGTTADNDKRIVPQTFGLAMGTQTARFYFLAHHTDIGNRSGYGYGRVTAGGNLNLQVLSLQGEASLGTGKPSFFFKAFSPYVKTFVGAGFSSFELGEPMPNATAVPREQDSTRLSSIEGATSILSVLSLGARYGPTPRFHLPKPRHELFGLPRLRGLEDDKHGRRARIGIDSNVDLRSRGLQCPLELLPHAWRPLGGGRRGGDRRPPGTSLRTQLQARKPTCRPAGGGWIARTRRD